MTAANIEQRVSKIILECFGCEPEKVTPEALMIGDLGADSLDAIEVVMALESEFEIEIMDDDLLPAGATDCRVKDITDHIAKVTST